jgi:endonuclease/exonuclease/phosphatase family metal-dependent hydrolase
MSEKSLFKNNHLLSILLFTLSILSFYPAFTQDFRVMTYNIRWDNPDDGINCWDKRKTELVKFIRKSHPEILGIQEGLKRQLDFMSEKLPQYQMIGTGRDDGKEKGEYSAIFFDQKKFKLIAQSTFWLSETSDQVSVGWDAALPRICTYGMLEDIITGERIHVFNTHFDHVGELARFKSAQLIISKIAQITKADSRVILMGDFNCTPDSAPFVEIKKHLAPGREISEKPFQGTEVTFNGFNLETDLETGPIDHIFIRNFSVKTYKHLTKKRKNGLQISDHFPVLAELIY